MSAPETTAPPRTRHAAAFLTGMAAAFAAFVAFHRFEFVGVGVRSAIGFATAVLLAGGALGIAAAHRTHLSQRLVPAVLAAAAWALWAAAPAGAGETAAVALGTVGAAALGWMLANVCRTKGEVVLAAGGALAGSAACSAGLACAVGTVAPVLAGTVAASVAMLASRQRGQEEPSAVPAVCVGETAPVLLGALAWGATTAGLLRAYVIVARSAPYAVSDLGMALAAGVALGVAVIGRRRGSPGARTFATAALLGISLLAGFSFFAYPALIVSEPAVLQTPCVLLGPGRCFPFWVFSLLTGVTAVALAPSGGPQRTSAALAAAAVGAAGGGLLAASGRWAFAAPVVAAAAAVLAAVAWRVRQAPPGERALLALGAVLVVVTVVWSTATDPQCSLLGLRETLAAEGAGPVQLDDAERHLTADGLATRVRRGSMVADFVNGHLIHGGAAGTMPTPLALTVALPLASARQAERVGVVSPALTSTLDCARTLAGDGNVTPFGLWGPAESQKFDVIVCGPGPLSSSGSPLSVLSREAMRLLRARLEPGGAFGLWLPVATLETSALRKALAAVRAEFPAFRVFLCTNEAVVLASADLDLDYARLRALQPALVGAGLWEPMDLVTPFATDSDELAPVLDGVRTYSIERPCRMPPFARRPATRLWAASVALLAQYRLAGPERLLDHLVFSSDNQETTALHAFQGVYAEQALHSLGQIGKLAAAGPPGEMPAFVAGPLVRLDLFAPATEGRDAQTATAFTTMGMPEAAVQALQRAVSAGHDDPTLHMKLAEVFEALNSPDDAIAQYREVLRLQPASAVVVQRVAGLLVALRRHREAADWLEQLLMLRPDDVPAMLMLAEIRTRLGQFDKAAELANRVLAIEPENRPAHEILILCGKAAPGASATP